VAFLSLFRPSNGQRSSPGFSSALTPIPMQILFIVLCLRNFALMEFRRHKSHEEITLASSAAVYASNYNCKPAEYTTHTQINTHTNWRTRIRTHENLRCAFINIILIVCLKHNLRKQSEKMYVYAP
jgi:hypothetical protein